MDKIEFIEIFRTSLSGKIPASLIEDHVRFYQDYMDTQIRQGKSEMAVLQELGDPRLLAKTIVEANKHAEGSAEYEYTEQDAYEYDTEQKPKPHGFLEWFLALPSWFRTILTVLAVGTIIVLVTTVLWRLLPIILVFMFVSYMIKMLRSQ